MSNEINPQPATATVQMTSSAGFTWAISLSDETVGGLLKKCKTLEEWALRDGWSAAQPQPGPTNGSNGHGAAPVCKYHGPMKRSTKFDGWYCTKKMADGSGYCKERVEE